MAVLPPPETKFEKKQRLEREKKWKDEHPLPFDFCANCQIYKDGNGSNCALAILYSESERFKWKDMLDNIICPGKPQHFRCSHDMVF